MRGDDAFAVLGLRPGAGRAEIDQAYRRLIKRYHPDYADGDAGRAAELNRAYAILRSYTRQVPNGRPPAGMIYPRPLFPPPARRRRPFFAIAAVFTAALVALAATMVGPAPQWRDLSPPGALAGIVEGRAARPAVAAFSFAEPLATTLIDASVEDALRLYSERDAMVAAKFSRDCLSRLSDNPSIPLFDSCASYDEAIAILATNDSGFESRRFNPSAVTARQVGAARLLSGDYFEAESRLQQIRSRVQMILLPAIPDSARLRARAAEPELRVSRVVPTRALALLDEPRSRPRAQVQRSIAAPAAQIAIRRPRPQPVARPTAIRRSPVEARSSRPAAPSARLAPAAAAAPVAPAAEPAQVPDWQKPIKPAWQRPLRSPGE